MAASNFTIEGPGKKSLSRDPSSIAEMLLTIRTLAAANEDPAQIYNAIQPNGEKAGYWCNRWIERMDEVVVCGSFDNWIGLTHDGLPVDVAS